ncbi:CRISPR-associated endoribonuclease Cas6 [Sporolactobacillus sp. THM19-2]|jgi:CRISPR-associated endoribonuclease Cas6|uniref:CRISPR-associated endoribonuclease Cas6 n=1 Tax=Sporolactobacillus sp. THM19-2 TaxID=2511171 RepID=UPI0010209AB7|nr:CRISPR-associated endoribonuclease Cas6 [Sporolactobacillus sp. THM19-2]RYL93718.1 hypothetical protein EWH91_04550 [Sporolactobacillus sp. THM19-2]
MRLRFTYTIDKFPLAYRLLIMALLKETVRKDSESFYQKFFVQEKMRTKDYSFATYFHNFQIDGDTILSHQVSVIVSSDTGTSDFMIHLLNGSRVGQIFKHNGTSMILTRIEMLKEKSIDRPYAWFNTCSPILIENKSGKPMTFEDPGFQKELNIISNKILQSNVGRSLFKPLIIEKNQFKKVVIKENFHQKFNGYLYFTVNAGRFLLSGDPRDLTYFYKHGIGNRSQYFGLLEKID